VKNLRMVLVLAIAVVATTRTVTFEDYARGVVDEDGNNLWHILADECDKPYFNEYINLLAKIDATKEEEKLLSLLASERNNYQQSPIEVAAMNWAHNNECKRCGDMMKMIEAWKTIEIKEHRSKKLNPFTVFLENDEKKIETADQKV
jgi:hypothetical protein